MCHFELKPSSGKVMSSPPCIELASCIQYICKKFEIAHLFSDFFSNFLSCNVYVQLNINATAPSTSTTFGAPERLSSAFSTERPTQARSKPTFFFALRLPPKPSMPNAQAPKPNGLTTRQAPSTTFGFSSSALE